MRRTVLEVSGTVLTAQLAVKAGLAVHLAGGTHHAHEGHGAGFTILNDLAVAAASMGRSLGGKVLVVDCDVHQGDGTANIVTSRNLHDTISTLSLHAADNYPHPKALSTWDVAFPKGTGDFAYMEALRPALREAVSYSKPCLVLYDAGVDVFEGDKLGKLSLTEAGIEQRDNFVIRTCMAHGIPIACVIGGGYDKDRGALAKRHAILHHTAAAAWRDRRRGAL